MMEEETGVMQPQGKECQGLPAITGSQEKKKKCMEQILSQGHQKDPTLSTS